MGLDNGIRIHKKYKQENPSVPWYVKIDDDGDVCYWRKCWGLRNDIVYILHMTDDEGVRNLESDDIPAVIRVIEKYILGGKDLWDEDGQSIWEFDEIKENLIQSAKNLLWLKEELERKEKEDIIDFAYFYDSY